MFFTLAVNRFNLFWMYVEKECRVRGGIRHRERNFFGGVFSQIGIFFWTWSVHRFSSCKSDSQPQGCRVASDFTFRYKVGLFYSHKEDMKMVEVELENTQDPI